MSPVSSQERLDWLRLYRSENVGPVTFYKLLEQFGSPGKALEALPDLARQGGSKRPIHICSKAAAEKEMAAIHATGARLLVSREPEFPALLRRLEIAPLIMVRGNVSLFIPSAIAVVGARNASINGRKMAQTLAAELGQAGLVTVSGMARGIDTAVHQASVASGTIAVLAGGVDVIYPPENAELYQHLCEVGAVVSEMPPGTQPQATHFPRRNRLISGLALGVVVVEASTRSGSLITAKLALDHGREVFAVPGSPLDPRCQGPNSLIKQGATLVESVDDILAVLSDLLRRPLAEPSRGDYDRGPLRSPDERDIARARDLVRSALSIAPVNIDEIIRQCQLSPSLVSLALLELELAGKLERHPGNRVSLIL